MQHWPIHDARLAEAVRRLVEGLHPRAIILFGSRARGNHQVESDYDLLVVSERLLDYDEAYQPVAGRGLHCDVVPCTLDAWRQAHLDAGGVLRDALDEGIVLYTVDDAAEEIIILNIKHPAQRREHEDA